MLLFSACSPVESHDGFMNPFSIIEANPVELVISALLLNPRPVISIHSFEILLNDSDEYHPTNLFNEILLKH